MPRGTKTRDDIDIVVDVRDGQATEPQPSTPKSTLASIWNWFVYVFAAAVLVTVIVLAGNSTTNGDAQIDTGNYPQQR